MRFRLIPTLLMAITLSVVTSKIVYFGFNSSYTRTIFSRKSFDYVFDRDVYKYRIISKYLLVALDEKLSSGIPEKDTQLWVFRHNKTGSEHLYYAFFYLNTFFLVLTSIIWTCLLDTKHLFKLSESEKYLLLFIVPVTINLSQFAVSPYDTSNYFFQLLILYVFLVFYEANYAITLIAICILMILATLNRESSALTVSALFLLLYKREGISKKSLISVASIAMAFIIPYILLRYYIPNPPGNTLVNTMAGDFTNSLNLTGGLFWLLFFSFSMAMAISRENRLMIIFYHLLSLPYIVVCLKDGVLWEVRLYMPLLLGALIFSRLDADGFKYPLPFNVQH